MSDQRLAKSIDRLAAAVERLTAAMAPSSADVPPDDPCIRCGGRGYLGHPVVPCHACDGSSRMPRS